MPDFSIPLAGMSAATSRIETAAARIARPPLAAATHPEPQDSVELSAEMVALIEARTAFQANANVVQTFEQLHLSLLNILA
jgi:flagellar hook-associated protein FlgK